MQWTLGREGQDTGIGIERGAALPAAAGLGGLERLAGLRLTQGFARAMWICAGLCWVAAILTWLTVGRSDRGQPDTQQAVSS